LVIAGLAGALPHERGEMLPQFIAIDILRIPEQPGNPILALLPEGFGGF
jgi:hypothetical protein